MGQMVRQTGAETRFRWLSHSRLPIECDLRRCGWTLEDRADPDPGAIGLLQFAAVDCVGAIARLEAVSPGERRLVLVLGIDSVEQRAMLLRAGFADALGNGTDIVELDARANRVLEQSRWMPREQRLGSLLLDLFARAAFRRGKSLGLNPREFALLWRLGETPNKTVSKETLIRDVWRMGFVPETNSIAVHMSRLRRKLALVGLHDCIDTTGGGYRLNVPNDGHAIDLDGDATILRPVHDTNEASPARLQH